MARDIFGNKKTRKEDRYTKKQFSEWEVTKEKLKMVLGILLGALYFYFVMQPQTWQIIINQLNNMARRKTKDLIDQRVAKTRRSSQKSRKPRAKKVEDIFWNKVIDGFRKFLESPWK